MKTDMKTQDFLQLYLDKVGELWYDNRAQKKLSYAGMAELADALDSGSVSSVINVRAAFRRCRSG